MFLLYEIHTSLCRTEMQNNCYQRNNPEHHHLYIQLERTSRKNITCLNKKFVHIRNMLLAGIHLMYTKPHQIHCVN